MIFPLLCLNLSQELLQVGTGKALLLNAEVMPVLEVKLGAGKISAFSEHTCQVVLSFTRGADR